MAILKPSYGTPSTIVTTGLNSLANTASATETAEHNNTTDLFIDVDISLSFTASGATTGTVDIYALEGTVTGVLASTAKLSNARKLGSVELNGTTLVKKVLTITDVKPFWKLHFVNRSGASLASEAVTVTGVNYTDV